MGKIFIRNRSLLYGSICHKKVISLVTVSIFIIYYFHPFGQPICDKQCPYQSIVTHNRVTFDDNHYVQHYSEFICPNNFRNLADWIYGWPEQVSDENVQTIIHNKSFVTSCLPTGSIIFLKADYMEDFFQNIYPRLNNKFVLITGQSDASAPGRFITYLENTNSKIIHWFGQNGDISSSVTHRFTHIPIGINCYEMANAIRNVQRRASSHNVPAVFGGDDEPNEYLLPLDITQNVLDKPSMDQILLLNFQRTTDKTGLRARIWEKMCNHNATLTFSTCIDKPDGVNISILSTIYLRNRQYPFWLSPRGNGIDCPRTWEALYLDAIPIVWNSTLNNLYVDLPIIILNNLEELTENFLRQKIKIIAMNKMKVPSIYKFEKIRFSYWRRLILSKSRHATDSVQRKQQCWRAKTTSMLF